jgi:hypothetical protein
MRYARIQINAIRSHPDLNKKIPVIQALEKYSKSPAFFIHFSNAEKVGINPKFNYENVIGVYSYNLKEFFMNLLTKDDVFATDAKNIFVLKNNTDKVLDGSLTQAQYDSYVQNLSEYVTRRKNKAIAEMLLDPSFFTKYNDRALGIQLMARVKSIAKNFAKGRAALILENKIFREIGIDAIITSVKENNKSFFAADYHFTPLGIFLSPSSYKVIDKFPNEIYRRK